MSGYYDRLQGTDRLLRIRPLPKALFVGIVVRSVLLAVAFTSPDPLGVSFVTHAAVIVTQGQALVPLLRNNVSLAKVNLSAPERDTLEVEPTMWEDFASWSLVVQNTLGSETYLTFVLEKGVVPTLFSTVPFLLFLYGGTQVAWWIVLRPIRDRTKAGSLSVATDVDESERVYDGSLQTPDPNPDPVTNPDIFNITAATSPAAEPEAPPPPVRGPPVSAPPPRVETPKPTPRPVVRQPDTAASLPTKAGALVAARTYADPLAPYHEAL